MVQTSKSTNFKCVSYILITFWRIEIPFVKHPYHNLQKLDPRHDILESNPRSRQRTISTHICKSSHTKSSGFTSHFIFCPSIHASPLTNLPMYRPLTPRFISRHKTPCIKSLIRHYAAHEHAFVRQFRLLWLT